jgi:hypothetical protein
LYRGEDYWVFRIASKILLGKYCLDIVKVVIGTCCFVDVEAASNQWRTMEFFSGEGGSTYSVEDIGQRERDL